MRRFDENSAELADNETPFEILASREDIAEPEKACAMIWTSPVLMDLIDFAAAKPHVWHVVKIKLRSPEKSSRQIAVECGVSQPMIINHLHTAAKAVPALSGVLRLKRK